MGVLDGGLDEDVEILRGPRTGMEGDGVGADDEVPNVVGVQRLGKLFVVAGSDAGPSP